jgi:hypothetical protein
VLVAGILAFASHLDVPSFTQFTVGLASAGVVTSYYLRRLGLPPRWMNMGAVGLLALFLIALTGQGPFAELVPVEAQTSQDVLLASALALAATFYSFVLISDEAVLFSCVFSIALIGLTGTVELNWPLIASFLMFLAGAIFLLVHQNYLAHRPRGMEQPQDQSAARREAAVQHLLRTQIGMALLCGMAAVLIGFCIAVPIQMAGKQMSLAGIIRRLNVSPGAGGPGRVPRRRGLSFDDPRRFEVGLGPVPDDPRVVLRVFGDEGFYWRGRTYGEYTGRGWIPGEGEGFEILQGRQLSDSGGQFRFVVPPARPDEALARAASARTVEHVYRPEGGFSSSILWAASEPRAVQIAAPTLRRRGDGSLALPGGGGGLGGLEGLGGGGLGRRDGPPRPAPRLPRPSTRRPSTPSCRRSWNRRPAS